MAFEPKPGNFSLFKNEKKKELSHPDFNFKIIFDQELITNLQSQLNAGKTPTLYGGAWVKLRDGASNFISGIARIPKDESPPAPVEAVEDLLQPFKPNTEEVQSSAKERVLSMYDTPPPEDDLPF